MGARNRAKQNEGSQQNTAVRETLFPDLYWNPVRRRGRSLLFVQLLFVAVLGTRQILPYTPSDLKSFVLHCICTGILEEMPTLTV